MPGPSQPVQRDDELVMFLSGKIATDDGTPVPSDASVQRICNNRVRQQVYTTPHGDFSMQMQPRTDSFVDASGDGDTHYGMANNASVNGGIPQHELENCELRASVSGFRPGSIFLMGLAGAAIGGTIDVGTIVVERTSKVRSGTLNAGPYKAPNDALKAYQKGLDAKKNGKLASAQQSFEKAVAIYPRYTYAWFQLGTVLEKENQTDAARTAFMRATAVDPRFLPPYLSLAFQACESERWTEVVALTDHILSQDPVKQTGSGAYVVDLDMLNFGEAYFYNALANYRLNKIDNAEKSALKAENHADPQGRFTQVHLLLAEIYYRKNNYPAAISEMRNYLELVPQGKDVDKLRDRLAKLEKLNGVNGKPDQE
jgi:thioredoxin-like negative regulator of GroEL